MTCDRCKAKLFHDVTQAFDEAIEHGISCKPDTRQEFSWIMMPYLIGWLYQAGMLSPATRDRWHQLSDEYGQRSLRKEVKTDARGY